MKFILLDTIVFTSKKDGKDIDYYLVCVYDRTNHFMYKIFVDERTMNALAGLELGTDISDKIQVRPDKNGNLHYFISL